MSEQYRVIESFRDLKVWQKATALVVEIDKLAGKLPIEARYSLAEQLRRASVSISSNIAEGHSRRSSKEYSHFLSIARGSKAECEAQLLTCEKLGYLTNEDISNAIGFLSEIGKMLTVMIKKINKKNYKG